MGLFRLIARTDLTPVHKRESNLQQKRFVNNNKKENLKQNHNEINAQVNIAEKLSYCIQKSKYFQF